MKLADIGTAIEDSGLAWRGALHPEPGDIPDGVAAETIILVGFLGEEGWAVFEASPEAADGAPDPLDRWSARLIGGLARKLGAEPLFVFGGPPWLPFQRWAQKAEPLHRSPLGMLIHPDYGLWHSWRGALAFRERFIPPETPPRAHPCESCADKPCLSACPVGAFTPGEYNVAACVSHISDAAGADCMEAGCRARRACPVGLEHRYTDGQAKYHMRAFRRAQQQK
ncbi:MAG: hypothetical protein ACE5FO_11290 [Parvularculaceae bacterium]